MSWEHAGAIPPRWDFGSTLAFWSEGIPDRVNEPAAQAVVAGYACEYDVPDPLDLGIFSATLCASLSWLVSRIRIALTDPDDTQRDLADRAVPWLLKDPPSRSKYQAVLDAVHSTRRHRSVYGNGAFLALSGTRNGSKAWDGRRGRRGSRRSRR
jgi:hypothetical protein